MTDTPADQGAPPIQIALPGGGVAVLPSDTDPEVVRQLRTALTAVLTTAAPAPTDPNPLNVALVHSVGLDPEQVIGFQLTVQGGTLPQLQVWLTNPQDDQGRLVDTWSKPLESATADTTMVVLPGSGTEAPLTAPRHPYPTTPPVPGHDPQDIELANTLHQLADIINGAGCTPDMRDTLTLSARRLAERAEDRLYTPGALLEGR